MCQINSKEYWENRFASKNWDASDGPSQTEYFAKLFLENAPQWLIRYVQENKLSVLDLGCAEGEGTKILSTVWENISGADISEAAVTAASAKFPDIPFGIQDVCHLTQNWDVVFISNVLEHFEKPYNVLTEISKHTRHVIIVMVPFEETADIEEHVAKFYFDNIPLKLGDLSLIYHNNIIDYDIDTARYFGQQIILVYCKDDTLAQKISLLESSNTVERLQESKNSAAKLEKDLKYSWTLSAERIGTMEQKLEREKRELMEEIKLLENELQNSRQYAAEMEQKLEREKRERMEEIKMLGKELQSGAAEIEALKQKLLRLEELEAQLAAEKEKYDNLYAYSCKRDGELLAITNSRSYRFFVKWLKKPMSIAYRIARKCYHILKALFTFNFSALKTEIGGPVKRVYVRLKGVVDKRKAFANLKNTVKGKRVVILPPTLDWHMPLFQRPQQLAASYARKENTVVIYLTKNIQYDAVPAVEKINPNLWLVNELYAGKLPDAVKQASEVILSVSWTPNKKYLDIVHPDKFIYEYIDELEIFHMYGPEMEADHQRLMRDADVTICTATKLYNQAAGIAKNPLLSPNAGDYEFFAKTDSYEISPWISEIVKGYKCVLGYYGALAAWFDYELVKAIAAKHPEWLFVLVGIDYDGTIGKSGIDEFKNIVHIPPQPYKDLPSFLKGFDIATIPFVINEITLSTSPVKLFEYMAAGRPIIASKMPECLKYESVKTYADADEFCAIVEDYMAMKSDDKYWDTLKKDALDNTWDARTDEILSALS